MVLGRRRRRLPDHRRQIRHDQGTILQVESRYGTNLQDIVAEGLCLHRRFRSAHLALYPFPITIHQPPQAPPALPPQNPPQPPPKHQHHQQQQQHPQQKWVAFQCRTVVEWNGRCSNGVVFI